MGVADDFARFRAEYIIGSATISSISQRYRRITRRLNLDFWGLDSETSHSLYVGSYGRDTAASGISDLDIAFVLPANLYQTYSSYLYNGPSQLLQAVKKSIQGTYKTSESFGDGQVVVINFTDDITFEVLPVFENVAGSWTHPCANAGGTWKATNPRAEIKAISDENKASNKNLKNLCRMMRFWRSYNNVPMSGWLIDTLAYQFMRSWSFKDKSFLYHDYMARDFFLYLANQSTTQNHWRAPGSGSYVPRKGNFETPAKRAAAISAEAIAYQTSNNEWSSRQKWRQVFGPSYPSS